MDFSYLVKQLDREIEIGEAQLAEKKTAREKLVKTLSPQEQTILDAQRAESKAPPKK